LTESAPELAARWTESIADPSRRQAQFDSVARQWLQSDPIAAKAWLDKLNLPVDQKKALFSPPAGSIDPVSGLPVPESN